MATTTITEYRLGRNFVRVGDIVRVSPSKPGKGDGFRGRILGIADATESAPVAVHLAVLLTANGAARHPKAGMSRTLPIDRIRRCNQKDLP